MFSVGRDPDPVVAHGQHGIAIDRDVDVDRVRVSVARDVRERLAQRRDQVIGDIVGDLAVDGPLEHDAGLESERAFRLCVRARARGRVSIRRRVVVWRRRR